MTDAQQAHLEAARTWVEPGHPDPFGHWCLPTVMNQAGDKLALNARALIITCLTCGKVWGIACRR